MWPGNQVLDSFSGILSSPLKREEECPKTETHKQEPKAHEEAFCYRHVEQDKKRGRIDRVHLPNPKYLVKNRLQSEDKSFFLENFVKHWNTDSAFLLNQVTKDGVLK